MKCGIIGLPNVGKSTLFNLLTRHRQATTGDFPFCTIKPNYGQVVYYDQRLAKLAQKHQSKKTIFSTIELADIAGLVKNAHQGSGLGNQFLSNIREVDCVIHLIRGFNRENYTYQNDKLSDDYEIINTELLLSDLQSLDKQIKNPKNQKDSKKLTELKYLIDNLPKLIIEHTTNTQLYEQYKQYNLLSLKPQIVVVNGCFKKPPKIFNQEVLSLNVGDLECMLNELEMNDDDSVIKNTSDLLKQIYKQLNLICFFTAGPKEARAWTIKKGTAASSAAGKIHKDFIKHFIKAEVTSYEAFCRSNNVTSGASDNVEEISCLKGPDYVVQDGDIINFRVGC